MVSWVDSWIRSWVDGFMVSMTVTKMVKREVITRASICAIAGPKIAEKIF
jgi:hypothetical protein